MKSHFAPGWQAALISLLLAALTLGTFHSIVHDEFIKFDDRQYVTENPRVLTGLSWDNLKWAFGTGYASNWHPLTWASHMLDVQLFGLRPGGHHFTSLLLHVANTVLLFLVLRKMTRTLWPGAIVAALFAVHPLHVESVAWVAERKDVLSGLFFFLTLLAYTGYAQEAWETQAEPGVEAVPERGASRRGFCYILALLLFALGLMSKPMLVTLPFLLLLLDWWPLGRMQNSAGHPKALAWLLWEKIPFVCLGALSSVVTFLAQAGSHSITMGLPMRLRVANAIVVYLRYLGKTIWPVDLAVFYPHPNTRYGCLNSVPGYPASEQWPAGFVLLAGLLLVAISALALARARRQPWFITGWFWYLGTLVPVIGLVQIGMQGMADRYTYIPLVGFFICVVWGGVEFLRARPRSVLVLAAGAALVVGCCAVVAHRQAGYWRNNLALFSHALKATRHNAVAESNVGEDLAQQGKLELAQEHFRAALLADPRDALAHMDLGICFELQSNPELALPQYQATVGLRPWSDSARLRLAGVLKLLGRREEALIQYTEALRANPAQPVVHYEMATILAAQNDLADGIGHLNEAIRLKPDYPEALAQLGNLLASQGKFTEAQAPLRQALVFWPSNAVLHLDLAKALMLAGNTAAASGEFAAVLRFSPDLPDKLLAEGRQFSSQGQLNAALVRFNTALWLKPDSPVALTEVAWILATHPRAQFRSGPRALRLAQRALDLSGGKEARFWAALDAAYAETGRFADAITAAEKARELALSAGDAQAAQACEARLALYRSQHPFHQ